MVKTESKSIPAGKKIIIFTLEIVSVVIILCTAYFFGKLLGLSIIAFKSGTTIDQLDNYNEYDLPTVVYSINGEKITEFTSQKRQLINFDKVPEKLINTFLLTEDSRFYKHSGLDFYSISRAALRNFNESKIVEGGSTISQQLAKQIFTDEDKTLKRKLYESWIALQIEKRYSKNEIFEKYLNKIYFGHGVYGVGAAARFFFAKDIQDLTLAESAMLAAIPSAPNKYSPFKNPISAKRKHKIVLEKLFQKGYFTQILMNQAYHEFWQQINKRLINVSSSSKQKYRQDKAPYFSEYVRMIAEKYLTEELGYDAEHLYTGGLQIYTTLNLNKQNLARKHLQTQLKRQDRYFKSYTKRTYYHLKHNYSDLFNFIGLSHLDDGFHFQLKEKQSKLFDQLKQDADILQLTGNVFAIDQFNQMVQKYHGSIADENLSLKSEGALVSIEPKTGHIIAMVGGRKFSPMNQFNRAVFARRQPGSTFKAFLYGAAIQGKFFHPNTTVGYKCKKSGDCAKVSVRQAIKFSINSIATKSIEYIGPQRVIDFAAPMLGIDKNRLPADPSLALGTGEVTPLELCKGIAVYANDGKEVIALAIRKITDQNGQVIVDFENQIYNNGGSKQLISPNLAYIMTSLLRGVVRGGTARRAVYAAGFNRPAAGKTGSTDDYRDAWFVGYTPNLVTTVWVGFDKGMSLGYRQFGGEVAAPVWARFMRDAHKDLPYQTFKRPTHYPPALKRAPWVKEPPKTKDTDKPKEDNLNIFKKDDLFFVDNASEKELKTKKIKKLATEIKKIIKLQTKESITNQIRKETEKQIQKSISKQITKKKRPKAKSANRRINKLIDKQIEKSLGINIDSPQLQPLDPIKTINKPTQPSDSNTSKVKKTTGSASKKSNQVQNKKPENKTKKVLNKKPIKSNKQLKENTPDKISLKKSTEQGKAKPDKKNNPKPKILKLKKQVIIRMKKLLKKKNTQQKAGSNSNPGKKP